MWSTPVAGSFSHFAIMRGGFAGFASQLELPWVLYIFSCHGRKACCQGKIHSVQSESPTFCSLFFCGDQAESISILTNVKKYFGWIRFWFAINKVIAVLACSAAILKFSNADDREDRCVACGSRWFPTARCHRTVVMAIIIVLCSGDLEGFGGDHYSRLMADNRQSNNFNSYPTASWFSILDFVTPLLSLTVDRVTADTSPLSSQLGDTFGGQCASHGTDALSVTNSCPLRQPQCCLVWLAEQRASKRVGGGDIFS